MEEDEMLDSVINGEKSKQLKVNTVYNLARLDEGFEQSQTTTTTNLEDKWVTFLKSQLYISKHI